MAREREKLDDLCQCGHARAIHAVTGTPECARRSQCGCTQFVKVEKPIAKDEK